MKLGKLLVKYFLEEITFLAPAAGFLIKKNLTNRKTFKAYMYLYIYLRFALFIVHVKTFNCS